MRRHPHIPYLAWIAIHFATALPASHAQTLPSTQPTSNPITEITLDNPLTPDSRCYLDLDTGKTSLRGQLAPDMIEQQNHLAAQGIDLMCETRPPSNGFVTYNLSLIETDKTIDSPFDYDAIRTQLEAKQPQPFDLVNQGTTPKTYEFQTSDRSIGVIEVSPRQDSTPGLRIRFKLLHAPPLLELSPQQRQLASLAQSIRAQQALLQTIGADQKTQIDSVQSGIQLLQKQSNLLAHEPDLQIAGCKMQLLKLQYLVVSFQESPGTSDPFIDDVKQRITYYQSTISVLERTRNSPSDRKAELLKHLETQSNLWQANLVRQYDQTHPVVNPALKELTASQKLDRMAKPELDRLEQCNQRVEGFLSPDNGQSPVGSLNAQILTSELHRYSQMISAQKSAQHQGDRMATTKPVKPTTFYSAKDFHL